MLIDNFGGTNSLRKILGGLKTKLEIFIGTRNILIPFFNKLRTSRYQGVNIHPTKFGHLNTLIVYL
jgi:hypothetical protein